jgi:hypothetical protein
MSKTWKWIIGIVIGLVVICVIAGLAFIAFGAMQRPELVMSNRLPRMWDGGRLNPRNDIPWNNMPMRPNMWMRGFLPFGGLLRGMFCLGFLVLIGLGVAALIGVFTQSRKPAAAVATPTPAAPVAEQAPATIPAGSCPNCQRPVEEGWNHCPYCGTSLTALEQ